MLCQHPSESLRPIGKPGVAHCRRCGQSVACLHPLELSRQGGMSTQCLGCGHMEADVITLKALLPTRDVVISSA